jgi:hypothetical protein
MAKMQDIQRQLESAAGTKPRASVVALAETRPPAAPPTPEATTPKLSPRAGKKHVGAHLNPAFTTNLLMAKARTGKKIETLIAEALNDLFRSLNLPVVEDE